MEIKLCTKCLQPRLLVNQKYKLCDECNYKRLHQGKSKQEVYQERARAKQHISSKSPSFNKTNNATVELKKKYSIKDISKTNKYPCSDGERVTQSQINSRYAAICDAIKLEREPFCQGTGRTDLPLSFSHTISRKRCKEIGKSELIWDKHNIEIESYHEPSSNPIAAHNIYESGPWEQKLTLLNIERKLLYIQTHDPEQFEKINVELNRILEEKK